jgi:hypothetical protein
VQDQFHHYFDSLHTDVATGETPLKVTCAVLFVVPTLNRPLLIVQRVVPHPTTLPRSLPEEEIVSEHVRRRQLQPVAFSAVKVSDLTSSVLPPSLLIHRSQAPAFSAPAVAEPASEMLFSDFADERVTSEMTPSQPTRQSSSSALKPLMTDPRLQRSAATSSAAASDPVADKRAAVTAQRQQQQQQQDSSKASLLRQSSNSGKLAAVGPQRTALAPLNRPNSAGAK